MYAPVGYLKTIRYSKPKWAKCFQTTKTAHKPYHVGRQIRIWLIYESTPPPRAWPLAWLLETEAMSKMGVENSIFVRLLIQRTSTKEFLSYTQSAACSPHFIPSPWPSPQSVVRSPQSAFILTTCGICEWPVTIIYHFENSRSCWQDLENSRSCNSPLVNSLQ